MTVRTHVLPASRSERLRLLEGLLGGALLTGLTLAVLLGSADPARSGTAGSPERVVPVAEERAVLPPEWVWRRKAVDFEHMFRDSAPPRY